MSKVSEILDQIVDEGCHCDMMIGFVCGIHRLREELEEALPPDPKPKTGKGTESWTKGREIPE